MTYGAEPGQATAHGLVEPIRLRMLLLVAAIAAVVAVLPIAGLEPRAHGTLVLLIIAAGLWMTEAVPIAWTALAIPVLAVLFRIADSKTAFSGFGDPIVFLFFGTFLLTDAAFEHGLQARLTHAVLHADRIRRDPTRILWAVALVGCALSMWLNNTATTALLLPVALTAEKRVSRPLFIGILLLCAYGPSFGGIATPVGTAPNLIGLRLLASGADVHISFARWCVTFAPLALLFTAGAAAWFHWRGSRRGGAGARGRGEAGGSGEAGGGREYAGSTVGQPAARLDALSQPSRTWSRAERSLLIVFAAVIVCWITPGLLQATPLRQTAWLQQWIARLPETSVPLLGGLLLFLLPSGAARNTPTARTPRILDIGVLKRIDWSTLLLFGGGLSLGHLMFETGLARAIGEWIFAVMPIEGTFGIVLAATIMAVLVSEVTSNTASASLVVPVVLALAQAAGVDPIKPALAATAACSWGFMLPVSTPPNALVYATGRVGIRDMVRNGIVFDVAGALAIAAWVTVVG